MTGRRRRHSGLEPQRGLSWESPDHGHPIKRNRAESKQCALVGLPPPRPVRFRSECVGHRCRTSRFAARRFRCSALPARTAHPAARSRRARDARSEGHHFSTPSTAQRTDVFAQPIPGESPNALPAARSLAAMERSFPFAGAAILRPAPAATDASHLRYLRSEDVTKVSYGTQECQMLHSGIKADSSVGPSDSRGIVGATQHKFCAGALR